MAVTAVAGSAVVMLAYLKNSSMVHVGQLHATSVLSPSEVTQAMTPWWCP